jgi:hypothetical protein
VAAFVLAAARGSLDESTGIDLNKLHHFPLSKIQSGWLSAGSRLVFDGITATATEAEVRLNGLGRSGKRWEAHMCRLDEVWKGDLDGNGTVDYVFFGLGPYGNGRIAPSFSLIILLMDPQGLPVPFFTVVYKGENGEGIKHLVDLDRGGRAELLISTYDEAMSDVRVEPSCSGHWTTQLYRFNDLGVEEFRGRAGGLTFPFVQDWRDRNCPEMEKPFAAVQRPDILEHGTSREGEVPAVIREVEENSFLTIDPIAGCEAIQPFTIVYERPKLRQIALPNLSSTYETELADAIRRDHARVKLRGLEKSMGHRDCSVNLLWASK